MLVQGQNKWVAGFLKQAIFHPNFNKLEHDTSFMY